MCTNGTLGGVTNLGAVAEHSGEGNFTMLHDPTCIAIDEAQAETQLSATDQLIEEIDGRRASGSGGAKLGGFIAVIESRTFIRECIRRSVQSAFAQPVLTYSTAVELGQQHLLTSAQLIIFSWVDGNTEASTNALKVLSKLAPRIPVIVLGYNNDAELARSAICHGAKGYIPVTMGFDIAIAAVRFVLAGGTYAPVDCLLSRDPPGVMLYQPPGPDHLTGRELAVTRAIQKGKSNKVIAYELNLRESTVKVHVRNVMRKLEAKNRTDVAIKAQTGLSAALPAWKQHLDC
jgi:DNA-binding NarL/FixJ family response regulator